MKQKLAEKENLPALFAKQVSLTEWLELIDHGRKQELRDEDSGKTDRLRLLNELVGLPFDKPTTFAAQEIAQPSTRFAVYVGEHGNELCALRLSPQQSKLPKLRIRGSTVREAVEDWFPRQDIDPERYRADFFIHPTQYNWSTIFVVNEYGIGGEIIADGHYKLTQGFYDGVMPHAFTFDFRKWGVKSSKSAAEKHLRSLAEFLYVPNKELQQQLRHKLGATFYKNYLGGYFETVDSEFGTNFIDYNRLLGELLGQFRISATVTGGDVVGIGAYPGVVRGTVRIITDPMQRQLRSNEILVCDVTTPQYVDLMRQAGAIITDRGGLLSHATITARELKKPCIVGTKVATRVLKDGDEVEVDADSGVVRIL